MTGAVFALVYATGPWRAFHACEPICIREGDSLFACDLTTRIVIVLKPGATFAQSHPPSCLQVRRPTQDTIVLETQPGVGLNLIGMHRAEPHNSRCWAESIQSCAKHVCMAGYFLDVYERNWLADNPHLTHLQFLQDEAQYVQIPLRQLGSEYPCRVMFPERGSFRWTIDGQHERIRGDMPIPPAMLFPEGMPVMRPLRYSQQITFSGAKSLLQLAFDKIRLESIPLQLRELIAYKITNQEQTQQPVILPAPAS